LDAAYHDIAESIHIERLLEHYKSGLYCGGTGPSGYSRQQHNYLSQLRRADQYSAELLRDHCSERSETMYPLDPKCSHRPTKRKAKCTKRRTKKGCGSAHLQSTELSFSSSDAESDESQAPPKSRGKHDSKAPVKQKVVGTKCTKKSYIKSPQLSFSSSDSESLESLHSVPSPPLGGKRDSRYRSQRSKMFELSLEKAKKMKHIFEVTQALDLCEEKLFCLTRPTYRHENVAPTYHVKIGKNPTCTCPYSQKKNVCKHRL